MLNKFQIIKYKIQKTIWNNFNVNNVGKNKNKFRNSNNN